MGPLKTVRNEARCLWTLETHYLDLPKCCPISSNPIPYSAISIIYEPNGLILEVKSLREYIDSFQGGRGEVRSMEAMIQQITQDCADALGVDVKTEAELSINPNQKMKLKCAAFPRCAGDGL